MRWYRQSHSDNSLPYSPHTVVHQQLSLKYITDLHYIMLLPCRQISISPLYLMRLWICRILLAGFCLGVLAFFACTHQDGGDAQPLLLFRKGDDSWHSPYCAVDELLRPRTKTDARECTAEELLPTPEEDLRYRWVPLGGHEARGRQYDCSCPYTKAT